MPALHGMAVQIDVLKLSHPLQILASSICNSGTSQTTVRNKSHDTLHVSPKDGSTYLCHTRFCIFVDLLYTKVPHTWLLARGHLLYSMGAHHHSSLQKARRHGTDCSQSRKERKGFGRKLIHEYARDTILIGIQASKRICVAMMQRLCMHSMMLQPTAREPAHITLRVSCSSAQPCRA